MSRLAQERRDAGLTAARQALHSYQGCQEDALTAFPLTPAAVRRKQVYSALPLSLREKRRGARPVYRRDVSASSAPARTPCHALEYSPCAQGHTRRDAVTWEQTNGPSA